MSPDNETKKSNRNYGINYTIIAKDLFLERVAKNNVRNNSKPWKNKNINLRMTKESE